MVTKKLRFGRLLGQEKRLNRAGSRFDDFAQLAE
jgi:hypothetical protein